MVFVSHAMQSHPCGGNDATEDKEIEKAKAARTACRGLLGVNIYVAVVVSFSVYHWMMYN